MKRDMELVREILLEIESADTTLGVIRLNLPGRDPELVSYHVKLLNDAGLIEMTNNSTGWGLDCKPRSLTWVGHEFLDAVRNDSVWNKVKSLVREHAASAPFDVLKALAVKASAESFGI